MDSKFVGPMKATDFIDQFISCPRPETDPAASRNVRFLVKNRRAWTADGLIRTLDESKLFSNFHFHNPASADNVTKQDALDLPHISVSFQDRAPSTSSYPKPERVTWDMFLELTQLDEDPFQDPSPEEETPRRQLSFQRDSNKALMRRRRLAYLILDMFRCRSRTFVFSVMVLKNKARLIRADRSGAVVTELFNWTEENSPLAVFLHRFSSMSREERGFDPTVTIPSPGEIRIARNAFERADVDADYPDFRMQKFRVCDEVTGIERSYVVGVPRVYGPNVAGTATNGYIAVDLDNGSLVWIKDSWRLNKSYIRKEADIYRMLMEANIPHVSLMICGGDVGGQRTRSQDFVDASWACETHSVNSRTHHRIVLSTIGRPLENFKSTRELTTAVRDAIEAHSVIFTKLHILHGDISDDNILITDEGRGILIDWNLAIDLMQEKRPALAGTWEFMSAAILDGKGKKRHELRDDLESFVHVFVYHIVRYRPTGVRFLLERIESVYHPYIPGESALHSSDGKMSFFGGASISNTELRGHISESAHCLVVELRRLFFRAIYAGETDIDPGMRPVALEGLSTSSRVLELFDTALEGTDWADGDGSQDMLEEDASERNSGKATTGKRAASAALDQGVSRASKRRCSGSSKRSSRSKSTRSRSSS